MRDRLGVTIHQRNDDAILSVAAWLGPRWWRAAGNWYDIQPQPDVWRWEYFDAIVAGAQRHDCSVALLIGGTPDWANRGLGRHVPPDHASDWVRFCEAVGERYQGKIAAYLLWNEPNGGYWASTLDHYVDSIVFPAYRTLKQIDPNVVIGAPELATEGDWPDWLRRYLQRAGSLVDVITVHAYDQDGLAVWRKLTQTPKWYEFWKKPSVRDVITAAGYREKPCWVTETGIATAKVGDLGQAKFYDQLLERLATAAFPQSLYAFQLIDEPGVTGGVFDEAMLPKPAVSVIRRYATPGLV